LTSTSVIKVGQEVRANLRRLANQWKLDDLHMYLEEKESVHIIELGNLAKVKGVISDRRTSLASLCGIIFSQCLHKTNDIRLSQWSLTLLTSEQKTYAAIDAYVSWSIWKHLSTQPTVGLPVTSFIPGILVDVKCGKKVVAHGHIISQPKQIRIRYAEGEKDINISPSRVLIEVEEIMVPGYEPLLHKISLEQMGPPPFPLVIAKSMLYNRNPSSPVVAPIASLDACQLPADIRSYPPPQILHPDNIEEINQTINADSNFEDSDNEDETSDDENDDQHGDTVVPAGDTAQLAETSGVSVSFITSAIEVSEGSHNASSIHFDEYHQQTAQSEATQTFPSLVQPDNAALIAFLTRILEDILHVEDRLLRILLEKHSAYKPFAFAFSQAIFVYDRDDRTAVEAVLKKQNMTWEYALRTKKTAIHRRVRRYVPPPDIVCHALETLFSCWQDVPCALDPERGTLFNKAARNEAKNILQTARLGFISDPPGIPLYYKMGVDRNGLPYYRCVRGTNSIEGGVHMPLRRTFGSLNASPQLTDALLCNIRHRRNTTIGHFNRTGQKHQSHFDQWLQDEIVEIAAEVGMKPSFPIPEILATRVATTESFGIIPIPKKIVEKFGFKKKASPSSSSIIPLHRDMPVHTLSRLSTRRQSVYQFLSERQQTAYAVVPVHTAGEFMLFKSMLNSGGYYKDVRGKQLIAANASRTVDFVKMAKEWTLKVHEAATENCEKKDRIYYKLPEQLEKYHKSLVQHRGVNATLANTSNMRLPISDLLSHPNRQAKVLPAIELPQSTLQPSKQSLSQRQKGKQKEIESTTEYVDVNMGIYNFNFIDTMNIDIQFLFRLLQYL